MQRLEFLKYTKLSMLLIGLWPIETGNTYIKYTYSVASITALLGYTLFIVTLTAGIVEVQDPEEFIVNYMIYMIFHCVVFWKIVLTQSKGLKPFVKEMTEGCARLKMEKKIGIRNVYESVARYNYNMFLVGFFVNFMVFTPFILIEAAEVQRWETRDYYVQNNVTRQLKITEFFPFDKDKYFEVAFYFQSFMAVWGTLYNFGCESYFLSLVNFAILRLKVLNYNLEHFGDYCNEEGDKPRDVLRKFVIDHKDILRFVQVLDERMKWFYFIDFIGKSYYLSMLVFATVTASAEGIMSTEFVFALGCVMLIISQLFCTYYSIEGIASEGLEMGISIYKSNWYEQPLTIQSSFLIMIQRSSKPIEMHLGSFGIVGTGSFIKIMKAAYSCVVFAIKE